MMGHARASTAAKSAALSLAAIVTIGDHTVDNVHCSVGNNNTTPLLGQEVLSKFKSWSIDNQRHVLVIGFGEHRGTVFL
jgi:hypothetical protein